EVWSDHDNCSSKEEGINGACIWMQLRRCGILLSSVTVRDVCHGFMTYLRNPALVGILRSVQLKRIAARSNDELDSFGLAFWEAITPHAEHIEDLDVGPSFYSEFCWRPSSAASAALAKFTNLKTIAICPVGERESYGYFHGDRVPVSEFVKS